MFLWNSQAILKVIVVCSGRFFSRRVHTKICKVFLLSDCRPQKSLKKINARQSKLFTERPKKRSDVLGVFDVKNAKRLFKLFWISSRGILSSDNLRSGIFFLKGRRKNCRHFFHLRPWPAVWSRNNRERGNFGIYSLREFVHKKSKVTFTIAF